MLKNLVKFWLSFSHREQIALLVLTLLMVVALMVRLFASYFISPPPPDLSKAALLAKQNRNSDLEVENQTTKAKFKSAEIRSNTLNQQLTPFDFDPNTANQETLNALGLKPAQIRNILNYRNKGGRFRTADDLGRLFTISSEEMALLLPYIKISENLPNKPQSASTEDTLSKVERPALSLIDLNAADSLMLLSLPGSGPWTAYRILRYRQALGGFSSIYQLLEVRGIDSLKFFAMEPWLTVDKNAITPLRINYLDFRDLVKHPYLSFDQVKALVNHRDRRGFIRNADELLRLQHYDSNDIKCLQPYLRFD